MKTLTHPDGRAGRSVRDDVLYEIAHNVAMLFASDKKESDDSKLTVMMIGVGHLSKDIQCLPSGFNLDRQLAGQLTRIAAHCAGWVQARGMTHHQTFTAIHDERERQIVLHRELPDKYLVDMEHPHPDPHRKLRVLVEEVGEVAKAIDELERAGARSRANGHTSPRMQHLITELIQVAAVAVAWLESLVTQTDEPVKKGRS